MSDSNVVSDCDTDVGTDDDEGSIDDVGPLVAVDVAVGTLDEELSPSAHTTAVTR